MQNVNKTMSKAVIEDDISGKHGVLYHNGSTANTTVTYYACDCNVYMLYLLSMFLDQNPLKAKTEFTSTCVCHTCVWTILEV